MAGNEKFRDADRLSLPVPSGVKSGDPVQVSGIVGVAQTARDSNGNATVWCKGAFNVTVADAIANVGDPVYIKADRSLTTTATGNTLFGYALATQASGPGVVPVKIHQA